MAAKIRNFFRQYIHAVVALALMLTISFLAFFEAQRRQQEHEKMLFDIRKEQVRLTIERRMNHYIQILKGSKAFFMASDTVTRDEWRRYVETLELEKNYPGIQGVGFSIAVPKRWRPVLEQKIRADGFSNFEIVPEGSRPFYTSIILLEPFTGRNLRAFGYDMWSEPTRRAAMQRARDTDAPALSARLRLVQETGKKKQPGFLLYLPVYKTEQTPASAREREQQLRGFVYSPFRSGDLFNNLIGQDFNDFDIEVYDGIKTDTASLLFDKYPANSLFAEASHNRLSASVQLLVAGRNWTVCIASKAAFGNNSGSSGPFLLLTGLLVISFLVFFIILSLVNKRRTNQLKQIITDNATAALFMMNAKGYCTFMNPAAEAMTGYTFKEIKKKPLHDLIHHHRPDGSPYPLHECPIDRALPTNNHMRAHEDLFFRKDGTPFYVTCAASPIFENGQPVSTVIEVRDITEIKEAEQKIRENTERLQKVFYHVPAIVGLVSAADLLYVLVNPMFHKLFGNRPLLGHTIEEAHPELKDQGVLDQLKQVIGTGKAAIGREVPLNINRDNTGELTNGYFNYVFEPILDDENRVESVLIFAVEVTELVKSREALSALYNELLETNAKLHRKNIDLDNFVYVASHDLKSPITNIEGLNQALAEILKGKLDPEEALLLKLMDTSVHKLRKTVQELTEITKIQKQTPAAGEVLQFSEIATDVLADIQPLISESDAQIITRFEVPEINYARKDLRSILYNLLSNAIRYRASDRTPHILMATAHENGKTVLIVQDNGLGIAKNQQHKLFGMFSRLHHHVEGSGTGLYIVKRIVENNGGNIEVQSEPGVGSTFKVVF